jgi:uncharacterized RDD family membrane protein YckC
MCAACRTPLAFRDEPGRRRLEVDLDLDRRRPGREPEAEPASAPLTAPSPAYAPDRSDWELGVPPDGGGEPELTVTPERETPQRQADAGSLQPASAAHRAMAWAIDGAILSVAALGLPAALLASSGAIGRAGSLAGAFAQGLSIVLPSVAFVAVAAFVYATVSHTLAGATLGKLLAGIRVVESDGRPPGLACSAVRSAWIVLSIALAGAGLLPALLSPSRRALHDLLSGTRVVKHR